MISTISDKLESLEGDSGGQYNSLMMLRQQYPFGKVLSNDNFKGFTFEDLLPCPVFEPLIYLKSEKSQEVILIDHLSSGEQQLINSFSAIIYHLRNIDSAFKKEGPHIKYENVLIFIDEVELYFHPEYQAKFVQFLLKWLTSVNIQSIKGVQLCISTHSPFILSDIPKQNILFLKPSKDKNPLSTKETFGANIYDILQYGFFLDKPMGDFAYNKIEEIITDINSGHYTDKFDRLMKKIDLIGDDYIREQLYIHLDDNKEYKRHSLKHQKEEIDRELNALDNNNN